MNNMEKGNIREAFEYAAKNPQSEFANNLLKLARSGALDVDAKKNGIDLTPIKNTTNIDVNQKDEKPNEVGDTGLKGFAVGLGKGVLSTIKGAGQLGEKIGRGVLGGFEKLTGLPVKPEEVYSEEALKRNEEEGGFMGSLLSEENLKPQTTSEKIGKGVEQVAEFAVPGSKITKATQGMNLASKIIPRAITSGTVASVQSGDVGRETAIAAGIETAFPLAGKALKPATKLISGLFRNIGSALSGVPSSTIKKITSNPDVAKDTVKILKEAGKNDLLRKNAKTIIDGVRAVNRKASIAYKKGLNSLSKTDIKPQIIKDEIKEAITSNKGSLTKNGFSLKNTEFFADKKLVKNASDLINKINKIDDLSGRGLRKTMELIDSLKLKKATTDVNMSFNSFLDDMSKAISKAISKSTTKLDEINKMYSSEKQLTETIESIIGKIKFNNEKEIVAASKKLNTAFKETDLTGEALEKLLTRIGIKPSDFQTSEAVRQISNISAGANTMGTNKLEIVRALTGSVVTPKMVRDISILTGKSEQLIKPMLEKLEPTARAAIVELFTK